MISDFFILAVRNVQKRKLRSWLTMVGIFISIATIFVLVSVSLGLEAAVNEQFRLLGTDKFFIQPRGQAAGPGSGGTIKILQADIDVIEKVNGIKAVSYSSFGNGEVIYNKQKRFFAIIGYPLDKAEVFDEISAYKSSEGRLLKEGDERAVMIGSLYKEGDLFTKPVHAGDKLEINGILFTVKGILQPIGNPGDDRLIYMSAKDFKQAFPDKTGIDQIIIQVNPDVSLSDVADRTERRLRSFREVTEKTQDFSVLKPEELLESFGTILNIITSFLLGVAAISLLVGGIGIANTMYTSVLERTKEIGTMKAVGAKNKDILFIFLIESGLIGLLGGIIGVLLGIGISKLIEYIAVNQLQTTLLKAALPWYLMVGCLLFAFLAGTISGVLPAWRATKIKPVDALRYE